MSLSPLILPMEHQRDELDRIVLLRDMIDTPPFAALINLMNELLAEDSMPYDIAWSYHDLAGHILRSALPDVMGDRWRDFILWCVLCTEHPFARAALKGRVDDVMITAMRRDLELMQSLFLLDDAMVRNWCQSAKPVNVAGWAEWTADSTHVPEGSDPLSAMQRTMIFSEDWGGLCGVLSNFFKENGTGVFVNARSFVFDGAELRAVPCPSAPADEDAEAAAHITSIADILRDARGAVRVEGGNTASVWHAALEEGMSIVELSVDAGFKPERLLDTLSVQPRRFALIIYNCGLNEAAMRRLSGSALEGLPENVITILV